MNILVICDNIKLLTAVRDIVSRPGFSGHDFTYATTSKFINQQDGIEYLDIKNEYKEKVIGKYELVLSVHCKQLFPAELVKAVRCVNLHPGFTPYNRGWYPHVFSMINKLPAGATLHEMDLTIDHGPVIAQRRIEIYAWETSSDVYGRVLATEAALLGENLERIIENKYERMHQENQGDLNSSNDFKQLCELDLDKEMKLGEAIDLLRSLTHPPYNNAFFTDKATNRKIYVEVNLKPADNE